MHSIIPESFRWYIAHDRPAEAKKIIERWAKINKRPMPILDTMETLDDTGTKSVDKKYTFIHLFQSKELTKVTLLLAINWQVKII